MTLLDVPDTAPLDFKRDRWGRPLIVPANGGPAIPYTRSSSAAKTIEDTYNLELWARRNVAYGMAHDTSLVARVLAIGGAPDQWDKPMKTAVNLIVEDAQRIAQSHKGADIGTAIHKLCELLDRGEARPRDAGIYKSDLHAYEDALQLANLGINPEWVECRMVCDLLRMAGTADRLVYDQTSGKIKIADLKTGATVDFGALGWAAQLAAYANGELYDVRDDSRPGTPEIDKTTGIIIHLPAGEGRCTLYEVDLERGLAAAKLANEIREIRKESKKWLMSWTTPRQSKSSSEPPMTMQPKEDMTSSTTSALPPSTSSEQSTASISESRHQVLLARYKNLSNPDKASFLAYRQEHNIAKDDLDGIEQALDVVDPFAKEPEGPPDPLADASTAVDSGIEAVNGGGSSPSSAPPRLPTNPDEGPDAHPANFVDLKNRYDSIRGNRKDWVSGLAQDANRASVPFHANTSTGRKTRRRLELYAGLVALAEHGLDEDEALRCIVATVVDADWPFMPTFTPGAVVGALNVEEAKRFAVLCDAVCLGSEDVKLRSAAA